jgi:peptidylprolyl isomerase
MISSLKRAGLVVGIVVAAIAAFFAISIVAPSASMAQSGTPHWILELEDGTIDIELLPELAPQHVERVVTLTGEGFYDGIVFHRVIPGFMAQSGDPTGTGMGGSNLPDLPAEFTDTMAFARGVVAAARTAEPNSANSQFFITYADAPWLNGQYTIFGRVVTGMEIADAIEPGTDESGTVANPDRIVSAKIEYR